MTIELAPTHLDGAPGVDHIRSGGLLELRNVEHVFQLGRAVNVHALSDVSFDIMAGETLGLVGESGCGKSTTARTILQSPRPTSGTVRFDGQDLTAASPRELAEVRGRMQMVFQDPHSSLNPRWTVRSCLLEPLQVRHVGTRSERELRVEHLVELVGLDRRYLDRKPGQLSGGQCQRVAIARALALQPDLVLFDEAVSSLDVSIQAQILNLIGELRRELSLTSLFIAHDLAVVKHVSDRVGVMYLGKLCEIGPAESVFTSPAHPYTEALMSAVPHVHDGRSSRPSRAMAGELPSPTDPPSGCRFRTRCARAEPICERVEPAMRPFGSDHFAACHHPLQTVRHQASVDVIAPRAAVPGASKPASATSGVQAYGN
jgi:peptide/nickel transport system ATP-binding protein